MENSENLRHFQGIQGIFKLKTWLIYLNGLIVTSFQSSHIKTALSFPDAPSYFLLMLRQENSRLS